MTNKKTDAHTISKTGSVANSIANTVADCVESHLEQLAQNKKDKTAQIENDEFSDTELASLVNPKRLQALLDDSDAFLTNMQNMMDDE